MEGVEQFAAALRDRFGTEWFTAHDAVVELDPLQLPPATRALPRQRGRMTSIGRHLALVPGIERTEQGHYRPRWRLP